MANNKTKKQAVVKSEEEIFNEPADSLPEETTPELSEANDEFITDEDVASLEPSESKIFGGQEEVFVENENKQMITVSQETLTNLLNEVNALKSKIDGADEPISLLKTTKRDKQVRVSFFSDPDTGEISILTGIVQIKLPTGTIVSTFRKPTKDMDGTTKIKDWMRVSLVNPETGEQIIKDVISEEFRVNLSSKYYLVKSEKIEDVDMTTVDETVYQMSYVENDRYLKRVETGGLVKTEVQGKFSYITVNVNDKDYTLPQNVLNFN